ncbi:MAG: DUF5666 domain-containing protein [Candidatus Dormibacteria bacterium]
MGSKAVGIVLAVVIGGLGGFYGGFRFGQNNSASAAGGAAAQRAGRGGFGGCPSATPNPSASADTGGAAGVGGAGRGLAGTITVLSDGSLVVHDVRCSVDTKVSFKPSVIVRKTVLGAVSDLAEGQTVTISGTRNPDGSLAAQSISIQPAGAQNFFRGGSGGGSGTGGAPGGGAGG